MKTPILTCALLLSYFVAHAEGTPQMRPTYNDGGYLYILDPTNSNDFAAYGATDERRLYFRVASTNERVYIGFGRYKTVNMGNNADIWGGAPPTTNEPLPLPDAAPGTRREVRFRILAPDNSIALPEQNVPVSGQGFIGDESLAAYNRCVAGPAQLVGAGGYYAIEFTPTMTGDYRIEFETYQIGTSNVITPRKAMFQLFDITVATGQGGYTVTGFDATTGQVTSASGSATATAIPGRVWSRAWSLSTGNGNVAYNGRLYPISNDGVVTEINFNGMRPFGFVVSCNRDGINTSPSTPSSNWITNRRSRRNVNATATAPHLPLYRIFLQNPDENHFPSGTIGCLHGANVTQCSQNKPYCINVTAQAQGEVEVIIDLHPSTPDGIYTPGTADVRITEEFNTAGPPQTKCLEWDGKDGLGNIVPSGNIQIIVNFQAGRTNLPIWDIENHQNGFLVRLVRPMTNACGDPVTPPKLYWHDIDPLTDTALPGTAIDGLTNLTGCTPASPLPSYPTLITPGSIIGCHRFTGRGQDNNASENINTWWYVAEQKVIIPYYNDLSTFEVVGSDNGNCLSNRHYLDVKVKYSDAKFSLSNLLFTITPTSPGFELVHYNAPYPPLIPNAPAGHPQGPIVVNNVLISGTPAKREVTLRYRINTDVNTISYNFQVSTGSCGTPLSPTFNINCELLPVELAYFSGVNQGNVNLLRWTTVWETNNKGFFIERSADGKLFYDVGFVAGAGNHKGALNYQYADKLERLQTYYYRLRQEDFDGTKSYSKIIALTPSEGIAGEVEIYQESTGGSIYVRSRLEQASKMQLQIYNIAGAKIAELPVELPAGNAAQTLQLPFAVKGVYLARLFHRGLPVAQQKLLFLQE